jgi:hypothetical protein
MYLKVDGAVSSEEHVMPLPMEQTPTEETLVGLEGGTCFDFNKKAEHRGGKNSSLLKSIQ